MTPPAPPLATDVMDVEIEKLWKVTKEGRPDAVVFAQSGDCYFVRGGDVETVKQEFGVRCFGTTIGFDIEQGWYFMKQLAQRGHSVLRVGQAGVRDVSANGQHPTVRRPRGEFIALDPALLFSLSSLQRIKTDQRGYEVMHDLIARDDLRGLREHGELYVFEFAGGYEIDWELSSMLPSRAFILGRAALDTRQKIPCRLVLPRAWRNRKKRRSTQKLKLQPAQLGQMRFDLG